LTDPESDAPRDQTVGVLLAAGAGRRAGGPKALRIDFDGTSWVLRSISVLRKGGCGAVVVVLGCQADRVRELLTDAGAAANPDVILVEAADWQRGVASSLRRGLEAVKHDQPQAVLVHLVDLPDVGADVVRRLLREAPPHPAVLARAVYAGRPGHPVLIGRDHLQAIMMGLHGDIGAKDYLARHHADSVECGDLAGGQDHDSGWWRPEVLTGVRGAH
jgi:CTP:molybdopterin cytidylyltransferase MocA